MQTCTISTRGVVQQRIATQFEINAHAACLVASHSDPSVADQVLR